jgi:hypothetical protein
MVKKIIFSFCLAINAIHIHSQDLPLAVDTTLEWSVMYGLYSPLGTEKRTHYINIQGDSIVNDISYKRINGHPFEQFLIREDRTKVYLLDVFSQERILYDFSLDIGDTITQINMFGVEAEWFVQEIDSIEIEGIYRKQIHLSHINNIISDTWIEGIGSTFGLVTPGNSVIDAGTALLCVKRNLQNIYSNPDYDTCYIYAADNKTSTDNSLITIYPNPVKEVLHLKSDVELESYRIIDISGKLIKTGMLTQDYKIELSEIRAGFYIIVVNYHDDKYVAKVLIE